MKVRSVIPDHDPDCTRRTDGRGGLSYPAGTVHEHVPDVEKVEVFIVSFYRGRGCCTANSGRIVTAIYALNGELLAEIDRSPTRGSVVEQ